MRLLKKKGSYRAKMDNHMHQLVSASERTELGRRRKSGVRKEERTNFWTDVYEHREEGKLCSASERVHP